MSKRNRALEEHYRSHYKGLVKLAARRVPDNSMALAEEAVQETYVRALKFWRTFDSSRSAMSTWMANILRNVCNNIRDSEASAGVSRSLEDDDQQPEPERDKASVELLRKYITEDMKHGEVISLYYLHGFKSAEIAEFTGKNHAAVRKIIQRWREGVIGV